MHGRYLGGPLYALTSATANRGPCQCTPALDYSVWNTLNETRVQAAAAGAFDVWRTGTLTTAETSTVYDDVFTGSASTRRWHELTWAGAWWPGLVSRYTDSFSQRTHTAAGGWTRIPTGTHAGSRIGISASCYHASYASAVLGGVILSVRLSKNRPVIFLYHMKGQSF